MGFKEIIVAFILLLLILKIVFVSELNVFIRQLKKHDNDVNCKYTWMILIPIIAFFYSFYIANKIYNLISRYKLINYDIYGRVNFLNLTNVILCYIFVPLLASLRGGYSFNNNNDWIIGLFYLFFLFGIISRFINGIKLYKDIKNINNQILNNMINSHFVKNKPSFSDKVNNNQYYGGYSGGHNSNTTGNTSSINSP